MRPLTDLSSRADSGPGRSVGLTDSPSSLKSAPESAPHGDRDRGNLIHEILSRLDGTDSRASIKSRLRRTWVPALDDITFEAGWAEACGVVDKIEFAELFNAAHHEFSRNEVSILYRGENGLNLYGRIDRVVVTKRDAIVVEYKTLANATADNAPELARPYYWQLRAYAEGIRKIWTNKRVRALVLFTRCAVSVEVDLDG